MSRSSDLYSVKEGDTLSEVARRHGTTVDKLCKMNGIANPNRIKAGQLLVLRPDRRSSVTVQLMDRDRNPIPNGKVRLDHAGKSETFTSEVNGRVPAVPISCPGEVVKIFLQRGDGTWKQITEVVSGLGDKLVTMISPKIKLVSRTMPHPAESSTNPVHGSQHPRERMMPSEHPQTTVGRGKSQGDYGDGKGPKTVEGTAESGVPITKVTNDQVELDFLNGHCGGTLSESDFAAVSRELGCEVNIIKAIARVESGGRRGFDRKGRPIILYERHVFSRNSGGRFDLANGDISSTSSYHLKKKSTKATKEELQRDYYANSSDANYMRLAKAYALDNAAALMACSWGMFQILGENYSVCRYPSVAAFVADHVKDEAGQLLAFVMFIKSKKLQKALQEKRWGEIARGYNGKLYKKFNYDKRLEDCYEKLCE